MAEVGRGASGYGVIVCGDITTSPCVEVQPGAGQVLMIAIPVKGRGWVELSPQQALAVAEALGMAAREAMSSREPRELPHGR